jgi:hypothetical protein
MRARLHVNEILAPSRHVRLGQKPTFSGIKPDVGFGSNRGSRSTRSASRKSGALRQPDGQITKTCPARFAKIFRFRRRANQWFDSARLTQTRGGSRSSRTRVEMRWTRQSRARKCVRRAVPRERATARADERRFNAFAKTSAGRTRRVEAFGEVAAYGEVVWSWHPLLMSS